MTDEFEPDEGFSSQVDDTPPPSWEDKLAAAREALNEDRDREATQLVIEVVADLARQRLPSEPDRDLGLP